MKALAWSVVVLALAGSCSRTAGPNPEEQATPQEQAAAEQQATSQPRVSPEQQMAAEKLGLPAVITNSIGMKLVLIPAGEFLMGSPETERERRGNEPQHRVTVGDVVELAAQIRERRGTEPQHRVRITRPFH